MIGRSQIRFDIRQASRRLALVLGGLAALNLVFYLLYVQPAKSEYQRLLQSRQGDLEAKERREQEVARREQFVRAVRQAQSDLTSLREQVLSTREERMVDVQSELEDLAAQFSIDLETVNYDNELLLDEGLDRFSMVVPLEGGYTALRKFLRAVESSDKFLVVERVGLAKGKEGGVLLTLNINLATYFNAPEHLMERKLDLERNRRRRG